MKVHSFETINVSLYDLKAQYLNNVIFNIKQKPLTLAKMLVLVPNNVFYLCIYSFFKGEVMCGGEICIISQNWK